MLNLEERWNKYMKSEIIETKEELKEVFDLLRYVLVYYRPLDDFAYDLLEALLNSVEKYKEES